MSSRKVREKLRERRVELDRAIEENRRLEIEPEETPEEKPVEEKPKKRGRPKKKVE